MLLDLSTLSTFADYFVIATSESERQMRALVQAVDEAADVQDGIHPRWEGRNEDGWRLADIGSIVVHLFSPEKRPYYNLEGLWQRAQEVVHIQ